VVLSRADRGHRTGATAVQNKEQSITKGSLGLTNVFSSRQPERAAWSIAFAYATL
jgi:hypothetical protein